MRTLSWTLHAAVLFTITEAQSLLPSVGRRSSKSVANIPPISFAPSQYFDGNDGPWSSFALQIGSDLQVVHLLPSTAAYGIWAVGPQGCPDNYPSSCSDARGGLFDPSKSSSWTPIGSEDLDQEADLGYVTEASFGTDRVTLGYSGSGGPTVNNALIAYFDNATDYFLGAFGINPRSSNFSVGSSPHPSYLSALQSQSLIPSLSYGYTAGNQYRLSTVFGSLILGGYDAARFTSVNTSIPMSSDSSRDLVVHVQDVQLDGNGLGSATYSQSFVAAIDSTVPFLYLPRELCAIFEDTFGLVYNSTADLYLVNQTLHSSLRKANPTVTLTLGSQAAGGSPIVITLPYGAFDLTVSYPYLSDTDEKTPYFPLRRATNDSQLTLGRAFLQEAYLIADYDRRTFTLAPCAWNGNTTNAQIEAILSPATIAALNQSGLSKITGGAIAGIVVGITVVLALIAFFLYRRYRRRSHAAGRRLSVGAEPASPAQAHFLKSSTAELSGQSTTFELEQPYSPHGTPQELEAHEIKELPADVAAELEGSPHPVYELDSISIDRRYELDTPTNVSGTHSVSPVSRSTVSNNPVPDRGSPRVGGYGDWGSGTYP